MPDNQGGPQNMRSLFTFIFDRHNLNQAATQSL